MAHVGDVAHVAHLVADMLQEPEEYVVGDAWAGVAQMGVAIDSGAADIHSHHIGMNWLEEFLGAGKGVVYVEIPRHCLSINWFSIC